MSHIGVPSVRKHPPRRAQWNSLTLEQPQLTELTGGIRIITDYVPHVQSFALGIWIGCGSRHDRIAGTAHLLEHVVFRRSRRYSGTQRARLIESLGGYLNASTSKEQTCYYVRGLADRCGQLVDLLAELAFAPAFSPADVDKERRIIREEILSYDDDPEEFIADRLDELLFGAHPLAHPIAGTAESIERIDHSELLQFHRRWYRGDRIAVIASGAVQHDEVVRAVEQALERWYSPQQSDGFPPSVRPAVRRARHVRLERPFQQAHCALGCRVPSARSPERYALTLLVTLLGDGFSSRLYRRLREQRALVYSVYATLQLFSDAGELVIYAGTDRHRIEEACEALWQEIARLATQPPNADEYERAREQVRSSIIMSAESLSSRMHALARSYFDSGMLESPEEAVRAVEQVSLRQVQELAEQLGQRERWSSVVIEPVA